MSLIVVTVGFPLVVVLLLPPVPSSPPPPAFTLTIIIVHRLLAIRPACVALVPPVASVVLVAAIVVHTRTFVAVRAHGCLFGRVRTVCTRPSLSVLALCAELLTLGPCGLCGNVDVQMHCSGVVCQQQ